MGNSQRLDGGAMFGNAPKALWSRWATPDALNRIPLACRCLLVQEPNRNVLFEAGIGLFFEPKMKERYGVVENSHRLLEELERVGLSDSDIDVVVLSHLHFDHAGGLLSAWREGETPQLLFPNATFVVGQTAWDRATNPHPRDRASYIPSLNKQLADSKRIELVAGTTSSTLGDAYHFHQSDGHSPGLILSEIQTSRGPVVFAADLIPGAAWVHLPITMGYDRFPEKLIDEKRVLLEDLVERNGWLFFTHDPEIACGRVTRDTRGRFTLETPLRTLEKWH